MGMTQMSNRERLLAALHSKEVDRLPWSPLMDGYFTRSLPLQGRRDDLIEVAKDAGCDLMERHVANPSEHMNGVERRQEKNGIYFSEIFETPVGSIQMTRKETGKTSYVIKNLIETVEDVKVYTYIAEHTDYTPNVEAFMARDAAIGDAGIATLSGNMSPVQELLQLQAGVENTVYLLYDYPEEMKALFSAMHERNRRQYAALAEYPCDVIFDYEDTSTTVMSRSMFQQFGMPAINDYADWAHQSGKLFITHMCGKLTGFLDEVAAGRQDGCDSICPPPTGDLCPWDARRHWGEKVLIGGIDPPELSRISAGEAARMAAEVINRVENKRGFILSTGDAVPYATPFENLHIIARLIAHLGARSLAGGIQPEELEAFLRG